MNKKLLCAALLGGLFVAQAASAQEYDDRWYLTGSVGYNHQDGDRNTEHTPFYTLGFGRFISPVWSIDGVSSNHDFWSDHPFQLKFSVDRVTSGVAGSAVANQFALNQQPGHAAAAAFVRTCFSTLVRDGNDFAIVLTDAQGRSLAQSNMSLPGFIGCLPATVRHFTPVGKPAPPRPRGPRRCRGERGDRRP